MKKILLVISCIVLCFALTSCDILGDILGNRDSTNKNEEFDTNKVTLTSAYAKAQSLGFEGTLDEFIELVSGEDGEDGVGITSVLIDNNGDLLVILTNGNTINCGKVKGADDKDGVTPTIEISADGYWVINGIKTEYKAVADGSGGDSHSHSFGEWIRFTYDDTVPCDAYLYYHICSDCKTIEWQNGGYENHSFTTVTVDPTCVSEGYDESTCSVCGLVEKTNYKAIAGHSYEEEYSHTASFHWLDCKYCEATSSYGEHDIDDSGYCRICDQPLAATEGLIYDLSTDGTYAEVIGYSGSATKIVIADTYNEVPVTNIYGVVFKNSSITSVVIPDSVTSIGDYAFSGCRKLASVIIGNSVTSIGDYAFYNCTSLTSVTIGNSVASIGNYAFSWCTSLTSVTIPDSVTSIGTFVFSSCTSLTSLTIGNSVTSIGDYAFNGCDKLASVIIGNSVTSIGNYSFYNCTSLISVTIPDSVTRIGSHAFSGCRKLASVIIGNSVTLIDYDAFSGCTSLTNVTIPNSVTSIRSQAFRECRSLTSVTIPDSVTEIGDLAFAYCSSLASVTIGNSVTSIGEHAFIACNSALYTEYEYGEYIGDDENPYAALIELTNKNLSTYKINENTKIIGDCVFEECARLTNITIPNSVTSIGGYAFSSCTSLTSVTIGNSVTFIGYQAFLECRSLTNVYYKGTESEWNKINIHNNNFELTSQTRYYYSETEPTTEGNFWYYDKNDKVTVW